VAAKKKKSTKSEPTAAIAVEGSTLPRPLPVPATGDEEVDALAAALATQTPAQLDAASTLVVVRNS
jgi:hypothetical protein